MGLRVDPAADEERHETDEITRENMGSLASSLVLGARAAQLLEAYGIAVFSLDTEGHVRMISPTRIQVLPVDEDALIQSMVDEGATEDEIVDAVEEARSLWKTTE